MNGEEQFSIRAKLVMLLVGLVMKKRLSQNLPPDFALTCESYYAFHVVVSVILC